MGRSRLGCSVTRWGASLLGPQAALVSSGVSFTQGSRWAWLLAHPWDTCSQRLLVGELAGGGQCRAVGAQMVSVQLGLTHSACLTLCGQAAWRLRSYLEQCGQNWASLLPPSFALPGGSDEVSRQRHQGLLPPWSSASGLRWPRPRWTSGPWCPLLYLGGSAGVGSGEFGGCSQRVEQRGGAPY